MRLNRLPFVIAILLFCVSAYAQKKKNDGYKLGAVTASEFNLSNNKIVKPGDEAVVLFEQGSTKFIGNDNDSYSYVFTCTRKIKLNKRTAFNLATMQMLLLNKQKISDINAITYTLKNGNVEKIEMDKSSVFTEKYDNSHILKKFTLPGLEEGCIIEYTYTITSNYLFNIPSWQFQRSDYPVLWSEYNAVIPGDLSYTSIKQGYDPFYVEKNWKGEETYKISRHADMRTNSSPREEFLVTTPTDNFHWVLKDVEPLKDESFIASADNYIDRIEFQLNGYYTGDDKSSEIKQTWQDYAKYFWSDDDFQEAFSNSWMHIDGLQAAADKLETAKKIFYTIQKQYSCTDYDNLFKYQKLGDVDKKKSGTERAINLMLAGTLKNAGITVNPVVLSTRDNGFIYADYPVLTKLNYLICQVTIDGKKYLLDASMPCLAFGELSPNCYNGYAIILDEEKEISPLQLPADTLIETEVASLFLSNGNNGEVTGSYNYKLGNIKSLALRQQAKTSDVKAHINDNLKKSFSSDISLSNAEIDNIDDPEKLVTIKSDISFKPGGNIIYLNPLPLDLMYKENPFKASERVLPVELPNKVDKNYILNMEIPAGYTIDELPKPVRLILNKDQGLFEYLISEDNGSIQMRYRLQLNKTNFKPEDYETLRKFFAVVVEKENAQIVFKKS